MTTPPRSSTPLQRPNKEQLEWAVATVEMDREPDAIGQAAHWLLLELRAVQSETTADEKDAARYRYLRENDDFAYRLLEELQSNGYLDLALWQRDLDESIDAAIKEASSVER